MKFEVRVATFRGNAGWTVEMMISAKALGLDEIITRSSWGLNAACTRRSGGLCELSIWTGIFVTPISRFGMLQLDKSGYAFDFLSPGNRCEGNNFVTMKAENRTKSKKQMLFSVKAVFGKIDKQETVLLLEPGNPKTFKVPYALSRRSFRNCSLLR